MKAAFEQIGHVSVTFAADSGENGQVCRMEENGKVAPCAAGEAFIGVMEGIRKSYTAVQIHGFAEVGYTGSTPAVGYAGLSADGNGGVQADAAGRVYLVVSVDESSQKVTFEL